MDNSVMRNNPRKIASLVFFFVGTALLTTSCGDNKDLNPSNAPADFAATLDVLDFSASPTVIDLDTARVESNNQTTVAFAARVRVSSAGASQSPFQIRFSLIAASANASPINVRLVSEVASPTVSGEIIYVLSARLSRAQIGSYTLIAFFENTFSQRAGQSARQKISVIDSRASAPQLTQVASPDTVRIPASGTSLIQITARATHPNGAAFIQNVTATRVDNRTITFQLFDDGDRNGLSGDQTAGDGVFTATLQVPSTNTPATRTFEYQAIDRNDLRSNVIARTITFIR